MRRSAYLPISICWCSTDAICGARWSSLKIHMLPSRHFRSDDVPTDGGPQVGFKGMVRAYYVIHEIWQWLCLSQATHLARNWSVSKSFRWYERMALDCFLFFFFLLSMIIFYYIIILLYKLFRPETCLQPKWCGIVFSGFEAHYVSKSTWMKPTGASRR